MAEDAGAPESEIAALRLGIDLGMTLIDTAEMYADGGAEEVVGEAIAGPPRRVFLVSKVLPQNASRRRTIAACEGSLRRLGTDRLDLYLLHGAGAAAGNARGFARASPTRARSATGASATSTSRTWKNSPGLPAGGAVATNQVLYNLTRRGIEYDLLPSSIARGIPIMAYSPIEQGRMLGCARLKAVAARHGATAAQAALAWVLRKDGVFTIPSRRPRRTFETIAWRSTSVSPRRITPTSTGRSAAERTDSAGAAVTMLIRSNLRLARSEVVRLRSAGAHSRDSGGGQ